MYRSRPSRYRRERQPAGAYTTELLAEDIVGFMNGLGIQRAHIAGYSLGAATGMWIAAKYPERVSSLSVHSGWSKTDAFIRSVVEGWEVAARALNSVADTMVKAIFPWCLTPELYSSRPDYIQMLGNFVHSRPVQPVAAFLQQTNAVSTHDAEEQLMNGRGHS